MDRQPSPQGSEHCVTATRELVTDLRKQVLLLEDDLRQRVETQPDLLAQWKDEHARATRAERTESSWVEWRDDRVTQAAVAWVLTTVFIRFCEDNSLLAPVWIGGPAVRRQEALDAQNAYFRANPTHTDREWLQCAIDHLAKTPATASLVGQHTMLHTVSPSGQAVSALISFWRERGDTGALRHDLYDPTLSTRFLGDLYQDLSQYAQDTFALLQTPEFVEEFILDQTMERALAERPLEEFHLIDPACGSGHFLLGAFRRLHERWSAHAPALPIRERVQKCLGAVSGVDLNPFAVAISRFRLTLAALEACGVTILERAPAFKLSVEAGDSLLHGHAQTSLSCGEGVAQGATAFTYVAENLAALQEILHPGRYDVVVGNPPYIKVKDKALNQTYRSLYNSCYKTYALTVPFMELFFLLAKPSRGERPAGWIGQIASNSFMNREFGEKLVETFLPARDLVRVIDSEGAWIPGHNMDGTPTVILVARNQTPSTTTVRAVLGRGRREARTVGSDGSGPLWRGIVEHLDDPGYEDDWLSVVDLDRRMLASHPWSLQGGGAQELRSLLDSAPARVADRAESIGRTANPGEDDAWFTTRARARSLELLDETMPIVKGEDVRDHLIADPEVIWWPFSDMLKPTWISPTHRLTTEVLWPVRTILGQRMIFGQTMSERKRPWYDLLEFYPSKHKTPLRITYAEVATHNHFVLDAAPRVFKQTAPVIKLSPGASEEEYLGLVGVLNSSTACFWLKQVSKPKGGAAGIDWLRTYQFSGKNVGNIPLPRSLPLARARTLHDLVAELAALNPAVLFTTSLPTDDILRQAAMSSEKVRRSMIAVQEELDWEVYLSFGIVDEDLSYTGDDLPELALGERAFEIRMARQADSLSESDATWFTQSGSRPVTDLPSAWPAGYVELVNRRLDAIESSQRLRLLERPEHKRRWASYSTSDRQEAALRGWLLDYLERPEFWVDRHCRPRPMSVGQLADRVSRDPGFVAVLALWGGRPDIPVLQSLTTLLDPAAVPYLAAYRLKESGLRKRVAWEDMWSLQRREDAGERVVPIPIPQKYIAADYQRPSWARLRGEMDLPNERFILYPGAGRATDPTPLLGWAGWDHAQQALALGIIIGEREAEGADDEAVVPLVAGLAELQPWIEQWHSGIDPAYGVSLAAFCAEQLTARARQVGRSIDQLRQWRPATPIRGRRPRS